MKKSTLVYCLFFGCLLLLMQCYRDKPLTSAYQADDSYHTKAVAKKSRAEQVAECAKCHPKEYENEMLGPHANSYARLLSHRDRSGIFQPYPAEYVTFVGKVFEEGCMRCHTGENLYDNTFKGIQDRVHWEEYAQSHYSVISLMPTARTKPDERMTGVDCLTCHKAGNNVITTEGLDLQAGKNAPCRPIATGFFSSNHNCASCHDITNRSMMDNIHNPTLKADMSCLSCHMEYDKNNKPTHYMYWRHDAPGKREKNVNYTIFKDIEVKIQAAADGSREYYLEWANKRSPHRFSECGELIVLVQVSDKENKNTFTDTVRLNNKINHDKDMVPCFGKKAVPGVEGYLFKPNDPPIIRRHKLSPSFTSGNIRISAYDKGQYWISDMENEKIYERTEAF